MRFRKIDRFLLCLAVLFVMAILRRSALPGEEVLPDIYRATLHAPVLAPVAGAMNDDRLEVVALKSELAAARRQILQLKEQNEAVRSLERYFRALEWTAEPEAIGGWVFAVDTDTFRRTFQIDRGTDHGIAPGLPVVHGKALLGVVLAVQKHVSDVRRVDDPGFRLEVEIQTADGVVKGVAQGNGDRGLVVRLVRAAHTLAPGDAVFTTSHHKKIPPGLVVGAIDTVEDIDEDDVMEVTVTPAAALGSWGQIEVVKRRKRG